MQQLGLEDAVWTKIVRGLVLGRYSLLLGAGASVGALNATGEPIPTGAQLAQEIRDAYGIPDEHAASLRTTYDLACTLAKRNHMEHPHGLLFRRFRNCTVPGWYRHLVQIPWNIVWNLNIDDVLLNAYQTEFANLRRQQVSPMSYRDKTPMHREPRDNLSLVHLHGMARDRDVVFGSLEYLAAASSGGAAHRLFWDSWPVQPVIVVGAGLTDELDMGLHQIRLGDPDLPSLVIAPDFSDFDRFRLDALGLSPIAATAEKFFSAVSEDWSRIASSLDEDKLSESQGINPNQVYWLRRFQRLSSRSDRYHDFFSGDEPNFDDILHNRDARRNLPSVAAKMDTIFPEGKARVVAFSGTLSGATTAELRFLKRCGEEGLQCVEFDGETKLDHRMVLWAIRRYPSVVIRVPDLDDFPEALGELISGFPHAGDNLTLRIVTSVRTNRVKQLRLAARESLLDVPVPERLGDSEIRDLLHVMASHNRLNVLRDMSSSERFMFFSVKHKRSLLDALAEATNGRSFYARLEEEYSRAADGQQALADVALISAEIGQAIPLSIAARALGIGFAELTSLLGDDPLSSIAVLNPQGLLVARQRGVASIVASQVPRERRYNLTIALAKALAPHITKQAIQARTRPSRIAAELMQCDRVVAWFGREGAEEWYGALWDDYEWNSRYWEQQALAELMSKPPRFEKAEAWAREAVARRRDSYSLNTLATVLLRRATSLGALDEGLFLKGMDAVEEARVRLARPSEHPYVTALSYLRRSLALATDDQTSRRLKDLFNDWRREAEESELWTIPGASDAIKQQIARILKELAV